MHEYDLIADSYANDRSLAPGVAELETPRCSVFTPAA
jgi:hypothetical protein